MFIIRGSGLPQKLQISPGGAIEKIIQCDLALSWNPHPVVVVYKEYLRALI